MKKATVLFSFIALLLILGFFVPIGSYSTHSGCPIDPEPNIRLHLIKGESLNKIKDQDNGPQDPLAGCAANAKYTLYFF